MKLEEFRLLNYVEKKNRKSRLSTEAHSTYEENEGVTYFCTTLNLNSSCKNEKNKSHFEIKLAETLSGRTFLWINHVFVDKNENDPVFYKIELEDSEIFKIKNELTEFLSIMFVENSLVKEIVKKCSFNDPNYALPIVMIEIENKKNAINSFIEFWLNNMFDLKKEEITKYVNSLDIFKNENLIKSNIRSPNVLTELIRNEPDWQTLLELKYRS